MRERVILSITSSEQKLDTIEWRKERGKESILS